MWQKHWCKIYNKKTTTTTTRETKTNTNLMERSIKKDNTKNNWVLRSRKSFNFFDRLDFQLHQADLSNMCNFWELSRYSWCIEIGAHLRRMKRPTSFWIVLFLQADHGHYLFSFEFFFGISTIPCGFLRIQMLNHYLLVVTHYQSIRLTLRTLRYLRILANRFRRTLKFRLSNEFGLESVFENYYKKLYESYVNIIMS